MDRQIAASLSAPDTFSGVGMINNNGRLY